MKLNEKQLESLPLIGAVIGDIYASSGYDISMPICEIGDDFPTSSHISDISKQLFAVIKALIHLKYDYTYISFEINKELEKINAKDEGPGVLIRYLPIAYIARSEEDCLQLIQRALREKDKSLIRPIKAIVITTYLLLNNMSLGSIKTIINKYYYFTDIGFDKTINNHHENLSYEEMVKEGLSALFNFGLFNYDSMLMNTMNLKGDRSASVALASHFGQCYFNIDAFISELVLNKYLDKSQVKLLIKFQKYIKKIKK